MSNDTQVTSAMTKGLIIGLGLSVIAAATYLLVPDVSQHQKFGWISYLIIIAAISWATYHYVKQKNGLVTFGNAFGHGFQTGAVTTAVVLVYTLLAMLLIFPEMKDKGLEAARTQMEADGQLSDSQIDQSLEMASKYFLPFAIAGIVVIYLICSCIGALIGAAIAPKKPVNEAFS